jgi:hypothetical protein
MSERGYSPQIHVISLFSNKSLSAGDIGTSQVIDLKNISQGDKFALAVKTAVGTNGTCGTTVFTYVGSSTRDGSYVTPNGGVAPGTAGTSGTTALIAFTPAALMPFMKIIATQTGAGTIGSDTKLTAELIVK